MPKHLIFFIIGVILGGVVLYGFLEYNKPDLSAQQAGEKAIEFINANIQEGVTASLIDTSEESGVYSIHLQVGGQEYNSYITKDGRLLFSSGILLVDEVAEQPSVQVVDLDSFAQCLTEQGAKFYGVWWCPHCQNQKDLFGESMQYIDYIECEKEPGQSRGDMTGECQEAGISGFPTWIFADGKRKSGEVQLKTLAEMTGCPLE